MTGRGIDRHLLGLRLLLRPLSGESSALFEDDLFERSSCWKLSTSGLSAGLLFKGTGFGAVYEDGYGINCMLLFLVNYGLSGLLTDCFLFPFRFSCSQHGQIWDRVQVLISSYFYRKVQGSYH